MLWNFLSKPQFANEIFNLLDRYPAQPDWMNPKWLMERDDAHKRDLPAGRKVGFVVYNGKVDDENTKEDHG